MKDKNVLVIGSGHLANRLRGLVEDDGYGCVHIQTPKFHEAEDGKTEFEKISGVLKELNMELFSRAYLVDDKDSQNLQFIIALMGLGATLPVAASLFNENVAPHLQGAYPNLKVLNPARVAAPAFVDALYKPLERSLRYQPVKVAAHARDKGPDSLVSKLIMAFGGLIVFTIVYFHFRENLSWLDTVYFVVVTVASVGYGDISFLHSSSLTKVINMVLIISSMIFVWMIFSLVLDRVIKKRIHLALGQRQYTHRDHVVVCGLGRLGYCIVEELLKRGEKIVVIESDENSDNANQLRLRGVDVYIGNARSFTVLEDVNVQHARALISVINNDYVNLEIGLNARSLRPDMRLILRVFDEVMAQQIKDDLDIHLTLLVCQDWRMTGSWHCWIKEALWFNRPHRNHCSLSCNRHYHRRCHYRRYHCYHRRRTNCLLLLHLLYLRHRIRRNLKKSHYLKSRC